MSTSLIVFEDPRRASDELFEQVFGEEVSISRVVLRGTYVYSEAIFEISVRRSTDFGLKCAVKWTLQRNEAPLPWQMGDFAPQRGVERWFTSRGDGHWSLSRPSQLLAPPGFSRRSVRRHDFVALASTWLLFTCHFLNRFNVEHRPLIERGGSFAYGVIFSTRQGESSRQETYFAYLVTARLGDECPLNGPLVLRRTSPAARFDWPPDLVLREYALEDTATCATIEDEGNVSFDATDVAPCWLWSDDRTLNGYWKERSYLTNVLSTRPPAFGRQGFA